ncbi:MAG: DUF1883 domain-containing protein [Defluviitaleaceae bacterium]|nr:DUF1883 domain-containing protein [Defluviitaleaceae bacterium]
MTFSHYDLGGLEKGITIEITLNGNVANVFLIDHENMSKYIKAKPFKALGGRMTFSPIRIQTIYAAHWHLVIDLPAGTGMVKAGYRVLRGGAPNISTKPDIFRPTEAQLAAAAAAAEAAKAKVAKAAASDGAKKEPEVGLEGVSGVTVTCPSCHASTVLGKFCMECGLTLQKGCPSCHTVNPLQSKFCVECGTKI